MQKFLLGAIIGSIVGLVIGIVFAAGSLLIPGNLVEQAARTIALCGGVAGFVGMFVGAVSGATFAVGGGQVKVCVAAVSLGFAAGALGARHLMGTQAGGDQLLYAAAGALGAASVVAWRGWRKRRRDSAPPEAQPWQRWFQFRLSTLMATFVATGAFLSVLISQPVMQRRAVAAIKQKGGEVSYEISPPSWLSFLLGDGSGSDESVVQVSLVGEQFDDTTFAWLKALPDVRSLYVNGAPITDEGLVSLGHLKRLETIELHDTAVTGTGLKSLHGLKHLTRMRLNGSKVSDLGLAELGGLTGLENLALQFTAVSATGLTHLAGLRELQTLSLSGAGVTDAGLKQLRNLPNLFMLELGFSQVTDAGLKHLRNLPKLQMLGLRGTAVSDAGLADLEELPELAGVNVDRTKVSAAGVERIHAMTVRNGMVMPTRPASGE
ncbi:MAG TPA: hypothetical protein VND64_00775 [Pirellulales bacterium]|nr:hypothetical protein [Pirellulales bacterium]